MPPLAALRAFAAFAERGTLVGAGGTLGVSHAAVSQQIRSLEDHLGLPLVDRTGRKLELTEAGAVLAQACSEGFGNIARTVEDITGVSDARAVHVSTTPTFAASWLMPRLPAFQADHPGIKLLIDPTPKLAELSPGGIDLAIRYGVGPWGRYDCQMLLESPIVVVAAPSLIAGRPVGTPTDLACLPWLEELGTTESTTWLHRHGVEQGAVGAYMQMPGNLVLDAARGGQGIAVTVRAFVAADIAEGRLVQLFEEPQAGAGYHLVTRAGVMRPGLRTFVRWLARQVPT
ncbi:LysR family transcriptional regulator [uncultured Pseudosulfitobacter sp.]|uniref:LysR family transcriptional regulator n=1 Tax=uncultured Pseudosulfitobacter sp. TaxID=2854214 RepID=UPI0030D855AE|tara:strand:+ start:10737 stop:11597 length:861 start_codon:yes stop_codon:yes gene_type:complete